MAMDDLREKQLKRILADQCQEFCVQIQNDLIRVFKREMTWKRFAVMYGMDDKLLVDAASEYIHLVVKKVLDTRPPF